MFWQGQELGENYLVPEDGLARVMLFRPMRWDYFYDEIGRATISLVRKLIALRRNRRELRRGNYYFYNDDWRYQFRGLLLFSREDQGKFTLVAVNFWASSRPCRSGFRSRERTASNCMIGRRTCCPECLRGVSGRSRSRATMVASGPTRERFRQLRRLFAHTGCDARSGRRGELSIIWVLTHSSARSFRWYEQAAHRRHQDHVLDSRLPVHSADAHRLFSPKMPKRASATISRMPRSRRSSRRCWTRRASRSKPCMSPTPALPAFSSTSAIMSAP